VQELVSSWFSVYDESRKQRLPDPGFYWFELQNGGKKTHESFFLLFINLL